MKEELYIYTHDGMREALDLPSPSGITLKWVNNLFSDISKLTCSHSYTFKIPFTQRNIRLLDMANDIRHKSRMIRKRVDADFYINGVCLCPNANLYVSEIGDTTFSCVLTWRVLKAFETLKGSSDTLNDLPSLGRFTWKDDDKDLQYGDPTGNWSNMADILYPNYDAGIPHEFGTPPKPVVPVYRLIQMINEKYGVRFNIGRQIDRGMGLMPAVNFNNPKFYGRNVYDDYVTYGVLPITGAKPFLSDKYVASDVDFINTAYTLRDGTWQQEGSYRKFVHESDDTRFFRKYEHWRDINVSKRHYWGGLACLKGGNDNGVVVKPSWNEYIGSDRFVGGTRETSVSEVKTEQLNMWWSESNSQTGYYSGRFNASDVFYAKRTVEGYMYVNDNKYTSDIVTLKLEANCEIRGTATVIVKKAAVLAKRVEAPEYWWMYIVEATKDDKNEVKLDTLSDNGEDWIGLRSIRREETTDAYVYYFDFGVEYDARRLKVDAIEEGSLGYLFWSGYDYTPPEDTTQTLQSIYEADGKEFDRLVAGYSDGPAENFPDIDKTDTFQADDVTFGSLHIASITPSLEKVTKLPVEMNIMENLPSISCFDFIKDIFYMNGALPRVDKDGKTIVAMYYNQLRDRMLSGESLDWSDKLVSGKSQASMSKYENTNFGQRNYFEMGYSRRNKTEEDKRDELELYGEGYGTIGINDSLLTEEKAVYQSKFFPGLRQDIAYPLVITGRTIKAWDGEKHVVTTTNPLYGYLNFRALDEAYEDVEDLVKRPMIRIQGLRYKHVRMNAFEPFENIGEHFGYLGAILENYTCVKEKMMLTEFDLRDFDESVPVYLHKYNAFFAVSSIQRDKEGVSTVELIALPYVKPEYSEAEGVDTDTVSYTWAVASKFLSFTLNLKRDYTTNPCPLYYDIFVNNRNEGWPTSYNTLDEGLPDFDYYLSKWVRPHSDGWTGDPYTLKFTVAEKVRYKVTKTIGFETVSTDTLEAGLKVYYDDVLLKPGTYTKTFTKSEDGQYHVFKFAFDIYNADGELIHQYRKKLYYFVDTLDKSVINDDWGEEKEGETIVKTNSVEVSGLANIAGMSPQNYTLSFSPSYANIKPASVEVTADTSDVSVSGVSLQGFTVTANTLPSVAKTVTLSIKTTLEDGSTFDTTHELTLVKPVLKIEGAASFEVANGTGFSEYNLSTSPSKSLTIKSVTSSNGIVVVSNIKDNPAKFRLSVESIASDVSSTITAVVDCDGTELTATKEVSVTYKNQWSPSALDTVGVAIVDINGMFYTKKEWQDAEVLSEDADGIAVSDGTHRLVIAKKETTVKIGGYKETGMTPVDGGYVINATGTLVSGQFTTESEETAKTDFNGKANTDAIIAQIADTTVGAIKSGHFPSGMASYLGAAGQWYLVFSKLSQVNELLKLIGGTQLRQADTSTQYNDKREWTVSLYNGSVLLGHHTKGDNAVTRAVADVRDVTPVTIAKLVVSGEEGISGNAGTTHSIDYTFSTNPAGATITDVEVSAGSNTLTITNVSASGFTVSVTIQSADKIRLTVTARVNGLKRIVEKYLSITVEDEGGGSETPDFDKLDGEGALIVDTALNYYTESEWRKSGKDASEAEGVAVSDGTHRFIIAKADSTPSSYMGVYWGGTGVVITGMERGKNYDGYGNTQKIIAAVTKSDSYFKDEPYSAAAYAAQQEAFPSGKKGYLGSYGEWDIVKENFDKVQALLNRIGKKLPAYTYKQTYWTSSIDDTDDAAYTFSTTSKGAYMSWARRWASKQLVRVFRKLEK